MNSKSTPREIPTHEEAIFDLSISCTAEQAVMRMLGWATADVYPKAIRLSAEGSLSSDDLESAHPETMTLQERLQEHHENARRALIRAAENGASFFEIHELNSAVEEARRLAAQARSFLMDIEDELAKGQASALRIDEQATKRTGITQINIRSLERWMLSLQKAAAVSDDQPGAQRTGEGPLGELRKRSKAEESVYVTLALAVTALARKARGKFLKGGVDPDRAEEASELNMSEIYGYLAELAASQAGGGEFPDQSESSIKVRLRQAFEARRRALKR